MTRGPRPLRVTIDATPLLGKRTGIGWYTEYLMAALARRPELRVQGIAFSLRGWTDLPAAIPTGARRVGLPVPATALRAAWRRLHFPPIELLGSAPDVVHGINFVLPPALRARGVVTIHDLAFRNHPETISPGSSDLGVLVPQALRRARVATVTTGITADAVSATYGFPRERILIAPPGVDENWFVATPPDAAGRAELGLPERYLLFVGTREPRKGLVTLIEAYRRLRHDRPDIPALILVGAAGWGDDATAGEIPGVTVLDYLDHSELQHVVAGAAALVLPSVDEGFGMPCIEAFATGTPAVVSDIPVLREVTGGLALTFPVGDAASLACRLDEVLSRDPDRDALLNHARRYTWENCADVTAAAYQQAAGH